MKFKCLARWIWIKKINSGKSIWSDIFCPGFGSSQVDPILFFWILLKSSWSNIFCPGFESSQVDPIFIFWIFLKWRDIFSCTRIRYFFVGSSPAALWRPCASLISALTKLNLAPRTNTSLSLPTLLNIKEKMKTTVSEPADDQRHFPTCRKKNFQNTW